MARKQPPKPCLFTLMLFNLDAVGLLLGAIALGAVHGIEPGHGWPVAAAYAIDQKNKWLYGFAASIILGIGHLISSIAMVAVFFYAKSYFSLTQINQPITIVGGIQIGGPVNLVAGVLLITLGIREYWSHSHRGRDPHETDHTDSNHSDDHDHANEEFFTRIKPLIPFVGDQSHSHSHEESTEAANRSLLGIAWFAFVLGFAHEEEFEIIGLCAGSNYCLELMSAYALTVLFGIVGLTLLLVAGYQNCEVKVEQYTPYFPAFSAAVLIIIGIGFIAGLL